MASELTALCARLEFYETPEWAAESILRFENLNWYVLDPCCGHGVLAEVCKRKGYTVLSQDVRDWGLYKPDIVEDFLTGADVSQFGGNKFSVIMNPPFTLATQFVQRAFDLGAEKVLCFQRFAWLESARRRDFWDTRPPSKVYLCGDRATCWRADVPLEERASGTTTPHAWFVFDRGYRGETTLKRIYKNS